MAATGISGKHLVFVYGTLKRGQPNHHVMTDGKRGAAELVGRGKTVDSWPLVIASRYNIPFLLHRLGLGHNIFGEVYSVDDPKLEQLDELEGYPKFYDRFQTPITLLEKEGKEMKPWIYFLCEFKPKLLEFPMIADYDSLGGHGLRYVERLQRTGEIKPNDEIKLS